MYLRFIKLSKRLYSEQLIPELPRYTYEINVNGCLTLFNMAIHTPNVITIEKIIFVDCMYKITIYLFNSMPCIFMVFPNDTSISIDYRSTRDLIQKRVSYNHDIISVNAKLVGVYHNLLRNLKIFRIHIKKC